MFYTKSGREIYFYGEEDQNLKAKKCLFTGINTLGDLFAVLLKAWCKETAYPSCQKDYIYENDPTYGQCAITATLVHDIFGGTIHKIRVDGGGTHYFNIIDGHYIDLTSDQFDLYDIPLSYENNQVVSREYCGKNADTLKRFNLLVERIKLVK